MSASVPKEEFALSEFQENPEPESVYGETAQYFNVQGMEQHLAVLLRLSREEMEPVEEALQAHYPQLSAASVDTAAHGALRRLWGLAPRIAHSCGTAAEFKTQLYKVLRPCVMHAGQDEVRKTQRQMEILQTEFFRYWEVEHGGAGNEAIGPAEVEQLLEALEQELGRMKCPRTLAVLEVIREYHSQLGGRDGSGYRTPDSDSLLKALRQHHFAFKRRELGRARARIRMVAERVMSEHHWWLHALPQAGASAAAQTANREE